VSSTRAAFASRRLRFAFFTDNRWRREARALKTFPRAVILKRFATDLRVLLRAMGFGISARKIIAGAGITNSFVTLRVRPQKHQIPNTREIVILNEAKDL